MNFQDYLSSGFFRTMISNTLYATYSTRKFSPKRNMSLRLTQARKELIYLIAIYDGGRYNFYKCGVNVFLWEGMRNMIYELVDTSKAEHLFEGWEETLIYSCLQKVMGKIYVTDLEAPRAAMAFVGCFGFYAGEPDEELVINKPKGFAIMVPQNREWAKLIEKSFGDAKKVKRFAIKKGTFFNEEELKRKVCMLPEGYELRKIDAELYDRCLENPLTADFVASFNDKNHFLEMGRGVVIIKDGEIVSGASSYSRYREGIEIEVDTLEHERRKHLATVACAELILNCLSEGLYPSWDAQNMNSVHLAEKLGYEFDHEYDAYEVN